MSQIDQEIRSLADAFAQKVVAIVKNETATRIRTLVATALDGGTGRRLGRPPGSRNVAKRPASSPAVTARRKLQGRYLGLLNAVKSGDRARVKATAKKDGVAAAVALAERLTGK